MDGIAIIVMLAIWAAVGLAGRASRKAKQQEAAQRIPTMEEDARGNTVRPSDIDVPGQRTVPIHWEGSTSQTSAPRASFAQDNAMTHYYDDILRPSEQSDLEDRRKKEMREEKKVASVPGLDLQFTGDTLVKGIIFSEILDRRGSRRTR